MADTQTESPKSGIKFSDIKAMYESGLGGISSRTIDSAHSYKVAQFKNKLRYAVEEMNSRHEQLLHEAGIKDGNKFANRLNELARLTQRTEAEENEFSELKKQNERFNELFEKLLEDKYVIEPKTMPYEQWRLLMEENKEIKNGRFEVLAQFETLLQDILWKAPEE